MLDFIVELSEASVAVSLTRKKFLKEEIKSLKVEVGKCPQLN